MQPGENKGVDRSADTRIFHGRDSWHDESLERPMILFAGRGRLRIAFGRRRGRRQAAQDGKHKRQKAAEDSHWLSWNFRSGRLERSLARIKLNVETPLAYQHLTPFY